MQVYSHCRKEVSYFAVCSAEHTGRLLSKLLQYFKIKVFREKGYLLPTWAWKNNLPTFRLNAPVVIRAKLNTCAIFQPTYVWGLLQAHHSSRSFLLHVEERTLAVSPCRLSHNYPLKQTTIVVTVEDRHLFIMATTSGPSCTNPVASLSAPCTPFCH